MRLAGYSTVLSVMLPSIVFFAFLVGLLLPYQRQLSVIDTFCFQGSQLPLDQLLAQLVYYLVVGWGLVILIGTFASALLIAIGFIYWFTGFEPFKGRRMVVGGIILLIAMQWLSFNPPWRLILG
jgi:hypothetical protein